MHEWFFHHLWWKDKQFFNVDQENQTKVCVRVCVPCVFDITD